MARYQGKKMKWPFNQLPDSNLGHYVLQLNLYDLSVSHLFVISWLSLNIHATSLYSSVTVIISHKKKLYRARYKLILEEKYGLKITELVVPFFHPDVNEVTST